MAALSRETGLRRTQVLTRSWWSASSTSPRWRSLLSRCRSPPSGLAAPQPHDRQRVIFAVLAVLLVVLASTPRPRGWA